MILMAIMAITAGVLFVIIQFLIEQKRMRTREKAFAKVRARNVKAFNGFGDKDIKRLATILKNKTRN